MDDESLSSISSSPSHSDISLDEDEVKHEIKIVNDNYNTIIVDNKLYLSRLLQRDINPKLDDFCRIFGSAIGKSQCRYHGLLELSLKIIDKISINNIDVIDILFKGVCRHEPIYKLESILSIKLISRVIIAINSNNLLESDIAIINGGINWIIWATQHTDSEVRSQSLSCLLEIIIKSIDKPIFIEIIQKIFSSGLIKRVYPVKEVVNYSQNTWKHLCSTCIIGWIYPLIDDYHTNVKSGVFKLLSHVMGFLNENDRRTVVDAAIDCFHEDADSSHITEILSNATLNDAIIKRLIKGKSGSIEKAHLYKQNKAIIQLLESSDIPDRSKQLLSDLLCDSITTVGDFLLYKHYLSSPANDFTLVVDSDKSLIPLFPNSEVLNLEGYIKLLQIAYPQRLDMKEDITRLNYIHRTGVEFGYTANHSIDSKMASRFNTLLDMEDILDPSFVTDIDFIDEDKTNNEHVLKFNLIDIKPEVHKIIIGNCETMALPGDLNAARNMNYYYKYTISNKVPPKQLSNCKYPAWQLIEFNQSLGFETLVTVEGDWINHKHIILLVKYPQVYGNNQDSNYNQSQKLVHTFTPCIIESQITFKIKLEYPVPTSSPIPVSLLLRCISGGKIIKGPSRIIWINPKA